MALRWCREYSAETTLEPPNSVQAAQGVSASRRAAATADSFTYLHSDTVDEQIEDLPQANHDKPCPEFCDSYLLVL